MILCQNSKIREQNLILHEKAIGLMLTEVDIKKETTCNKAKTFESF